MLECYTIRRENFQAIQNEQKPQENFTCRVHSFDPIPPSRRPRWAFYHKKTQKQEGNEKKNKK